MINYLQEQEGKKVKPLNVRQTQTNYLLQLDGFSQFIARIKKAHTYHLFYTQIAYPSWYKEKKGVRLVK